ncbi:hypothetical protein BH09MYX1_BH09MYX1_11020 [soil metagenome]
MRTRVVVSVLGAGASALAAWIGDIGVGESLVGALLVSSGLLYALRSFGGPSRSAIGVPAPIAVVPWGVIVEDDRYPRILRWAAIRRVHLQSVYGRDEGTPSTLWSFLDVETDHERYAGRAAGAVPLEGLLANLAAYTRESSAKIALDLDGLQAGEGPTEPDVGSLIAAAEDALHAPPTSSRLAVPHAGYRGVPLRNASAETVVALREILGDRSSHDPDRRPLAAILAGILGARALIPDLLDLVQSPHPVVAAVARAAAQRIGAPASRTGRIDEIAPFLHDEDVLALNAWNAAGASERTVVPNWDEGRPAEGEQA